MPHSFCLADSSEGRALASKRRRRGKAPDRCILPDGKILTDPSNAELAQGGGLAGQPGADGVRPRDRRRVGRPVCRQPCTGPRRDSARLVVDEGGIGGQATSSSLIRNYLGFPRGVSGRRLAQQAYEQAWVFGANFAFMQRVTDLRREHDELSITLSDGGDVQRPGGAAGDGRQLSPTRHPGARGFERRGRLLRRPGFRGACHGRPRRLRPRWRELGRAGCPVPRAFRPQRHARRACSIARRRYVSLPGAPNRGDAQAGDPARDRDRRRRRERLAGAARTS